MAACALAGKAWYHMAICGAEGLAEVGFAQFTRASGSVHHAQMCAEHRQVTRSDVAPVDVLEIEGEPGGSE